MNYWSTFKHPIVSWSIDLDISSSNQVDEIFNLASHIIKIGTEECIYKVLQTRDPNGFRETPYLSYIDYIQKEFERTRILNIFPLGFVAETDSGKVVAPSCISYFINNEDVKTGEISNMGVLQQGLAEAGFLPEENPIYHVAPISISTEDTFFIEDLEYGPQHFELDISLYTDIWFQRVIDFREDETDMLKNQLAHLHTPRFNNFLNEIKAKSRDIGGRWVLKKVGAYNSRYLEMCTENGIILDR